MSYHIYQTEGIVLARRGWGEANALYVLYTEQFGATQLFAKGVRLEKSKLRGRLNLFSHVRVRFVAGRDLYRLIDVQELARACRMSENMYRFQAASAVARFVKEVVSGQERDEAFWSLLLEAYDVLERCEFQPDGVLPFLYTFQIRSLRLLGYIPEECPVAVQDILDNQSLLPRRAIDRSARQELDAFLASIYPYATGSNGWASYAPSLAA